MKAKFNITKKKKKNLLNPSQNTKIPNLVPNKAKKNKNSWVNFLTSLCGTL